MADGKRCMTQLDAAALAAVTVLRRVETRSESQMIAILVKEAIAVRRAAEARSS